MLVFVLRQYNHHLVTEHFLCSISGTSVCLNAAQDTAKKTKWVVELVQGIMADNDASTETVQAQHGSDLVCANPVP